MRPQKRAVEYGWIIRDVQDAKLISKGAKRNRTKSGTRRERGTTEKQGDIAEVGVLTEEPFS